MFHIPIFTRFSFKLRAVKKLMNAEWCNFFVGCCMSYKNIAALSSVGILSTYITLLSWFMLTLSEFYMISIMVFALTNFLSSKTCTCPKLLSV